ncbi:hypothetical protein E2562_012955 [Oryza meyeriana var. granulata]|uniref:Uncharacterized protein n=1 Tax=Oryza meyeriana var. granulata TaxID=110450 RepID=A0A6G1DI09_9ORYZ|nr:hypothetical protein E2562_012955 [Oryza meyeriana var. granulata]
MARSGPAEKQIWNRSAGGVRRGGERDNETQHVRGRRAAASTYRRRGTRRWLWRLGWPASATIRRGWGGIWRVQMETVRCGICFDSVEQAT